MTPCRPWCLFHPGQLRGGVQDRARGSLRGTSCLWLLSGRQVVGGHTDSRAGPPRSCTKTAFSVSPRCLVVQRGGEGGGEAVGQPRAVSPRAGLLEGRDVGLTWQLLRQHEPQWEARNAFPDSSSSTPTGRLGAGTSRPWLPAVLPEIRDF